MTATEAAAAQVSDAIFSLGLRTPTLPPATHTNAYLLGTDERLLVEPASPYPEEIERCIEWVEAHLRGGGSLRAVLLTHHHADHVGGASAVAAHFGVPVWAHAATRERLEGRVHIDRDLADGEVIRLGGAVATEVEAFFTPGHAPGHLCFIERRSGHMIAGDMVAQVGTILVEPGDGDMALYLQSLKRMAERRPTGLLPAHGGPLRDPQATLDFYVRHRLEREARVLAALEHQAQPTTARQLLPLCYADTPRIAWPLAERSTEAHLLKLEQEGRVRRTEAGWLSAGPGA